MTESNLITNNAQVLINNTLVLINNAQALIIYVAHNDLITVPRITHKS